MTNRTAPRRPATWRAIDVPWRRRLVAALVLLTHLSAACVSIAHAVAANPARDTDCALCHLVRHARADSTLPVHIAGPERNLEDPEEPFAAPPPFPAPPACRSRAPPGGVA